MDWGWNPDVTEYFVLQSFMVFGTELHGVYYFTVLHCGLLCVTLCNLFFVSQSIMVFGAEFFVGTRIRRIVRIYTDVF